MQQIITTLLISLTLTLVLFAPVNASEDQERAALARLLVELNALTVVVLDAENAANSKARYRFDYPALQRDLHLVQQGLQDHINRVQREPGKLPAVEGNFQGDKH